MTNTDQKPEDQNQDPLAPEPIAGEGEEQTEEADELYAEADPLAAVSEESVSLAALQKEYEETKDKMIRAVAEAENARKRAVKEREDARKYSITGFAKDLVNTADNLRRALDALPEGILEREDTLKPVIDGIEATERELLKAFELNGIKKLEPQIEAEIFDPNKHEVMFEAPGTGKPAGTIIQIIENGYTLHDRLLRPARVGVAKAEEGEQTPHVDTEA
ncbi:MAG: nucleotide exchange factor GrpE [Alphaproteobacteria bacterium]